MSAYVVIEATVKNTEARDRYASESMPLLKQAGATVLHVGPWSVLHGKDAFINGMLIEFPDREAALDWYHSPAYQALVSLRTEAMDCRFRLLG